MGLTAEGTTPKRLLKACPHASDGCYPKRQFQDSRERAVVLSQRTIRVVLEGLQDCAGGLTRRLV
jgi:hypothetical protein